MSIKTLVILVVCSLFGLICLMGGCSSMKTVPAGHVAVATLFGDVQEHVYSEGLNFPVNPLLLWSEYDIREKSLDVPNVPVPTKDQQTSFMDVSVIYRINRGAAPAAKSDVGLAEDIVNVKLTPNLRSQLRSQGKAVKR